MIWAILVCTLAVTGCKKEDEIARYQILKSRSGLQPSTKTAAPGPVKVKGITNRMVVAIAQRDDATWFFKINGPIRDVDASEKDWQQFLSELTFADDGNPAWTLPDGWSEKAGNQFRYKTLIFGIEGNEETILEMAISKLGPNQNLLANVNRWRGQIGKENTTEDNLGLTDGQLATEKILMFDEKGTSGTMGGAPFAPFASGRSTPRIKSTPIEDSLTEDSPIQFDAPEGWTAGRVSSIVLARLHKTSDDKAAQISVTRMSADANTWEPNAIRWGNEVGVKLTEDQIMAATESVTVDGITGQKLTLIGDQQEKGTIAIMIKQDQSAWFLKMTGEQTIVSESKSDFESFIQSFRLSK